VLGSLKKALAFLPGKAILSLVMEDGMRNTSMTNGARKVGGMTAAETAAIRLIREAGFEQMAKNVECGRDDLTRTLQHLSRIKLGGEYRILFSAALASLGGRQVDHLEIRDYVEGRRKSTRS